MSKIEIDWSKTNSFKPAEWPKGVLEHMDVSLMHELFELRKRLPNYCAMIPSPLVDAHIRQKGSSRHSIEGGTRKSDATDLFVRWAALWPVYQEAQRMGFGGIGLYLDTRYNGEIRPMIHLDMRSPERIEWVRYKGVYYYRHKDPIQFFAILSQYGKKV